MKAFSRKELVRMRRAGMTHQQIGKLYNPPLTRQRVQQICDRLGIVEGTRYKRRPEGSSKNENLTLPPIDPVKARQITREKMRFWGAA
jgi:hypothetical protein